MSEASINQVIKRIGYCGSLTGHGVRHTQCRLSSMSKVSTVRGLKSNWLMWMKTLSVVPIIMHYICQCGKICWHGIPILYLIIRTACVLYNAQPINLITANLSVKRR